MAGFWARPWGTGERPGEGPLGNRRTSGCRWQWAVWGCEDTGCLSTPKGSQAHLATRVGAGQNSANQSHGADGTAVRPRTPSVYAEFSLGTSRPTPSLSGGCSPRRGRRTGASEAAPREHPHLHAQRPGLLTLRPRRLLLRRVAATLPALLVPHAASRARRWPLMLAVTPPSPAKPPSSLEKLPRSRSRGRRHTNSAGRLLLPGAWGVVTPRRRSGRARARAREKRAAGESLGVERFGEVGVGSPLVLTRMRV